MISEPRLSKPPVMKRRLSWGVVGVVDVVDEVPDLFIMIILKRRVGCSTIHF